MADVAAIETETVDGFPSEPTMADVDRIRGYVYRLAPTAAQIETLERTAGVCRLVYNLAREQRVVWGQRHFITAYSQCVELTALRNEFEWISEAPRASVEQALLDLDKAFLAFFSGKAGFPTPRKKGVHDTFRTKGRDVATAKINRRWARVRLPKIGWIKYRNSRDLRGQIKSATVRRDAQGWTISFLTAERCDATPRIPLAVGIDRGVSVPVMLSTGERHSLPASMPRLDRLRKRAQRVAARRIKGSRRRQAAQARANSIASRIARVRAHWQHELTTSIARRYGVVSIEALKTRNMTASAAGTVEAPGRNVAQKRGLNRSILNVGWFGLEQKLAYKLSERGGVLCRVDPAYTSQTCSACGAIDSRSRESQARFVCCHCGFRCNADLNAAINIEQRGNAALLDVEGGRQSPAEASTHGLLATAGGKTGARSASRGRCLLSDLNPESLPATPTKGAASDV